MKKAFLGICVRGNLLALTLTLFSLVASPAMAESNGTWNMIINGKAFHISKPPKGKTFNEANFGSGFQYEFKQDAYDKWVSFTTGSAFIDSFENMSYYIGGGKMRRYKPGNGWNIDVGMVGFAMARKDVNNYRPFIGVLPVASIGTKDIALNFTYVPPVDPQLAELVFVQLKIAI